MSDYSDLRDAIVAVVEGVPDIGLVYGRQRYAGDWTAFLNQFKTTIDGKSQIRGWTVTRESVEVTPARYQANEEVWTFVIRGHLGFQNEDDSEGALQDLATDVVRALNARTDLGVSNVVDYGVGPASMRVCELRAFGSTLVNFCEIVLPIDLQVGVTFVAN